MHWRNMTAAQRYNYRKDKIFDAAYALARAEGKTSPWDKPGDIMHTPTLQQELDAEQEAHACDVDTLVARVAELEATLQNLLNDVLCSQVAIEHVTPLALEHARKSLAKARQC